MEGSAKPMPIMQRKSLGAERKEKGTPNSAHSRSTSYYSCGVESLEEGKRTETTVRVPEVVDQSGQDG